MVPKDYENTGADSTAIRTVPGARVSRPAAATRPQKGGGLMGVGAVVYLLVLRDLGALLAALASR